MKISKQYSLTCGMIFVVYELQCNSLDSYAFCIKVDISCYVVQTNIATIYQHYACTSEKSSSVAIWPAMPCVAQRGRNKMIASQSTVEFCSACSQQQLQGT